jgi:general secretion pathway protein D
VNKIRNAALGFALLALLVACTAGEQTYKDGRLLIEQGQIEPGLKQLEQAMRENPRNLEFRTYYIRQRDQYVIYLLQKADAARGVKQYAEAEDIYRRVFAFDSSNLRAAEGLEAVRMDRRHAELLDIARKHLTEGKLDDADKLVRQVLNENPRSLSARELARSVEEKQAAEKKAGPSLSAAFRKPITLEFRDANLKSIFEVISRATNINFIFDRDVRPDLRSTIFVKNTTIEDVINLLMVTNQLDRRVLNDNTILIYPNTPAKAKDYQELITRAFYLTNADVKQTLNMIKTLVKSRDVFIDEKLNLLVMKDTPEAIRLAEKLIATQDRAEAEVMLEVEVMEVKRSRLLDLGVVWPNQFTVLNIASTPTQSTTGGVVVTTSAQTQNILTVDTLKNLTGSQIAVSPNPQVNLKKEDGDAQILANPRIRVKNKEKAKVHIGEKVPVITTTSTANVGVSESVNYLDIGLKLDVEPVISLDNEVSMKVGLEVSNIVREIRSQNGSLTYQVGTRNAATVLRLKDGETQVLAGLISDEDRSSAAKVPGLGDLPLLGRLFSSQRDENNKTEIILLITPHIVRNVVRPELAAMEFSAGTDSTVGGAPLNLRAVQSGSAGPAVQLPTTRPVPPAAAQPPAAQPAASAALSFVAPPQVKLGGEFALAVNLNSQKDVKSLTFDLVYEDDFVDLVDAKQGAYMSQGGDVPKVVQDRAPGHHTFSVTRTAGGATGAGAVAQFMLRVVESERGATQFSIENVTAQDAAGQPVSVSVPQPVTVTVTP